MFPNDVDLEPDYAVDPGTGNGEPDLEELLQDLPEETRAAVQTRLDAEANQRAQSQIDRMKGGFGRWGQAQQVLAQDLGLVVDDRGNVAAADPSKLLSYAQRFGAPAAAAAAPQEPDEEPIVLSAYDDDETLTRKTRQLMERELRARQGSAESALEQRVKELEQLLSRQYQAQAPNTAKETLSEYGLDALADTAEYQAIYGQIIQSLPAAQQADPEALATAAMMAVRPAQQQLRQQGKDWRPAPGRDAGTRSPRAVSGAAARAALGTTGASRSLGAAPRGGGVQLSERDQDTMQLMGITDPEEYLATQDPTGDALRKYYDKKSRGRG